MRAETSIRGLRAEGSSCSVQGVKPKILIATYHFYPSVGGMEAVARLLADRIARSGYSVSVVTDTSASGAESFPYRVMRRPPPAALWAEVTAADLVVVNHPSLRLSWPLLLQRKPFVVIVQCWAPLSGVAGMLRRRLFRRGSACIAISTAIDRHLPVRGRIIPSPYDETVFFPDPAIARTRDLLFVGRMVEGKGPLDLVEALRVLREKGTVPTASFVGDGPARILVERRIRELGLERQVRIHGSCDPEKVAALMREHWILVVPSIWEEPFGVVALEGIACGCVVIGSCGGGLPDAVGPCGLLYPNGNIPALAERIEEVLGNPDLVDRLRTSAREHLDSHTGSAIVMRYIELFDEILENR